MSAWLRLLGVVVLALGVGVGGYAGTRAAGDTRFAVVAAQYERHAENPLFQAEYYAAAGRYYGLIGGAIGAVVGGLVFGSLLIGLGMVLARVPKGD